MSALLQAHGLEVATQDRVLVRGLELCIGAGECWALVGPNGAGKTMLLRTLAGLRAPRRGRVLFQARDAYAMPAACAAALRAYLPQTFHDAFPAPVLDVVLLGAHAARQAWQWPSPNDVTRARDALAMMGAADLAHRDIGRLSGGERQRVGLATLLVQSAPLMLLDEPVAHLDVSHGIGVLECLTNLAKAHGRGLLFSVHDLSLAARFATHVLLFRSGGRVDAGPTDAVLDEESASEAFGHPIRRGRIAGRTVFVPA